MEIKNKQITETVTTIKNNQISHEIIYTKEEIKHLEEFEKDKLPEVKKIEKNPNEKKEFNEIIKEKTISSQNSSIKKELVDTNILNKSIFDFSLYEQIQIEVDSINNSR